MRMVVLLGVGTPFRSSLSGPSLATIPPIEPSGAQRQDGGTRVMFELSDDRRGPMAPPWTGPSKGPTPAAWPGRRDRAVGCGPPMRVPEPLLGRWSGGRLWSPWMRHLGVRQSHTSRSRISSIGMTGRLAIIAVVAAVPSGVLSVRPRT